MKYLVLIVGFCLSVATLRGQDPHFSQFHYSPQTLNPAMIGDFDGVYRINANQKTQWRQVTRPYSTFALMGDGAPIFLPRGLDAGIIVLNDRAGDSKFNIFSFMSGAAYGFHIPGNEKHAFRIGLQMGVTQIKLNESDLTFDNQYNGLVYDPQLPTGEHLDRQARWYFNLNLGALHSWEVEKRKTITAGVAGHNLSAPKQSFYNDTGVRLPLRLSFHLTSTWRLTDDLDALPAFRHMSQGTYSETIFGSSVRYILLNERSMYRGLLAGYYGRFGDSGIAMVGMEFNEWRAALSYDINVSDLKVASRNRGGFEISLQYIFGKPADPSRSFHRYCPDFL